ncbi:hypothetical protein D9623_14440 [Azospirillum brasilense]|uniref:Uncharacterized protein n=1 Tax=Azospirillum brasilense TaxID=192 RepID=A0A4D8R1F0_AZOBR|nr:hypothetical protein D3868_19895 [Azospirillum brasilense]QEL91377.1 hypothetical protein D9621_14220 [Azospirillum brasilense]QEL97675.1 hypothetical protein D9623_14440 [Azospirillum brasilense]
MDTCGSRLAAAPTTATANRKTIAETTSPKAANPFGLDPQSVRMFLPMNARGKTLSRSSCECACFGRHAHRKKAAHQFGSRRSLFGRKRNQVAGEDMRPLRLTTHESCVVFL